jgi:hypothetical protein
MVKPLTFNPYGKTYAKNETEAEIMSQLKKSQ